MTGVLTKSWRRGLLLAAGAALLALPLGFLGVPNRAAATPPDGPRDRYVFGDMGLVADSQGDGHPVVTWALVTPEDDVEEVGVTIPVALLANQPQQPGDGPAGAVASLAFPALARETTYFDHLEIHTNPAGHGATPHHADPDRYRVPHFDFHFYAIPEADVWAIPRQTTGLADVPADLLPAGYDQPHTSVRQMGRHAYPLGELPLEGPFSATMLAGFLPAGDVMHFIEPMVTRALLLERDDFELPVPMPEAFGRRMLYPTKFEARYDPELDAYHFVFSEFVAVR